MQLERHTLETSCGAPLQATLCRFDGQPASLSDGAIAIDFDECDAQQFYIEVSLASHWCKNSVGHAQLEQDVERGSVWFIRFHKLMLNRPVLNLACHTQCQCMLHVC